MAEDNNKTAYSPFDINRDGVIDEKDAQLFSRYLNELRGDALVEGLVPNEEGVPFKRNIIIRFNSSKRSTQIFY